MMKKLTMTAAALLILTGCTAISDDTTYTGSDAAFSASADASRTAVTAAAAKQTAQTSQTTAAETVSVTTAATTSAASVTTAETDTVKDAEILPAPSDEYDTVLEVLDTVMLSDIVPEGTEMLSGDIPLDTSAPGDFSVRYTCLEHGMNTECEIFYSVRDTVPPMLLNAGWGCNVETGDEFDLLEWVGVGDYYDDNVTIEYTGTVDTSAAGEYPISVTASDSSGNVTEWSMTVNVVDTLPQWTDDSERQPFGDLVEKYGGCGVLGIDVSKWQGTVDFKAVKKAGCEFVIMRIGKDTSEPEEDICFERNFREARKAGLKVGVYFYTTANSEEMIKRDAEWIADRLDGAELDFPVAFDWEDFSCYQEYGISIYRLNRLYDLFDEEMKAFGYDTMLYSSKNFLLDFWETDKPVWLAHYTRETDYTGDHIMWQMSCTGRIDGIAGDVDVDILYDDDTAQDEQEDET